MHIGEQNINQFDFKTIIDNAAEGICVIQDERIVYHNDAATNITGYPSEIYIRTPILKIFDHEDAKRMVDRYKQRLDGEDVPAVTEARFIRYDGSRGWMQSTSSQTEWKGKLATVNFFIDITERKMLEEELRKKNNKLQKALDEIKTLKGLIPICASCKKIRDDKGFWNQLESYIEKYSDASFSHSICPECSDKLYGEEDWYIEMKRDEKN